MASSMEEYLKRYAADGGVQGGEDGKKRKKKKKAPGAAKKGFIIKDEDDGSWYKKKEPEEGDAKAVVVIDYALEMKKKERERMEKIRAKQRWTSADDPSTSGREDDISPPRRGRRHDSDDDLSPPRKGRAASPDLSPPRKGRRHDSDDDMSPPRKGKAASPDISPPRKGRRHDSDDDLSPPRKGRAASPDLSPPRRGGRHDSDEDMSPPRKGRAASLDISPPRRTRAASPDLSPPRRGARHDSPDLSPPRKRAGGDDGGAPAGKKPKLMSDGTVSGLRTGYEIKKEIEEKKVRDAERFRSMDADRSGKNSGTVFRGADGKKVTQDEYVAAKKAAKGIREETEEDTHLEWGEGLKQKRDREGRRKEMEKEANKPFARYADDPEIDADRRRVSRWGDPMAGLVKAGDEPVFEDISKAGGVDAEAMEKSGFIIPQGVPAHSWTKRKVGEPYNRYNIRPGRHWDGVDRSNGFERDMFKYMNEKKSRESKAYAWSTEEM